MDKHLLTEIEIKDFKCFKDFKADGFKRVNLIGGMNNVGKTAFLEACLINVYSIDVQILIHVFHAVSYYRNRIELACIPQTDDDVRTNINDFDKFYCKSNIQNISFDIIREENKKEFIFNINSNKTIMNMNDFFYEQRRNLSIKYIDKHGLRNKVLKEVYEAIQLKDAEDELFQYINTFDNNILNFKFIGGDKPQLKTINDGYLSLSEFGDGIKHYISIICSLYACEDSYLFIDEIEDGLHYTVFDNIWTIILELSKQLNVQVFATTHSKECIESYARVSKKLEDRDICYVKMSRLKDGSIKAGVRDFEMLQDSIDDDHEVRGW